MLSIGMQALLSPQVHKTALILDSSGITASCGFGYIFVSPFEIKQHSFNYNL